MQQRDDERVLDESEDDGATGGGTVALVEDDVLVEDDFLIEDVSIDGMCGVY
jgi:mycofactocin precursor